MASLDAVIQKLFQDSGSELIVEPGSGIHVRTPRGLQPVMRRALTPQQVIGAFAEIVPADLKAAFPQEGATVFPYGSPAGAVSVRFELSAGRVKGIVTPYGHPSAAPEEEETLELASPADMLELAAAQASTGASLSRGGDGRTRAAAPASAVAPASSSAATAPPARAPAVPASSSDAAREMDGLLRLMLERRASDLHLSSQNPPMVRVDGDIVVLEDQGVLTPERLKALLWSIAPAQNKAQWEERKDTDFAHETEAARFRVNVFADRRGIGSVIRQIPNTIKSAEEMGLSKQILELCGLPKGLVLVTGPTGSGKSTTLAALIDYINRTREDHIITVEDPIEFVHPNKKCLVNQREVGVHTSSFKQALRAALREDPDIVLVGEMRDLETISIAIETAETGHLVFGTLHTNTAPSTVDRIIDQFPTDRQAQVRTMLSESLRAVISQTLCKKIGGGRAAAQEVLIVTSSVANLIREGKTFQIPSIMQTGRNQGMITMNDALMELVRKKMVEPKDAYAKAVAKGEFRTMLERAGLKIDAAA